MENKERNHALHMNVIMGDIDNTGTGYDILLSNINRNVLLLHIPKYSEQMKKGELLLSGFYEEDLGMIRKAAESVDFVLDRILIKNRWIAARFIK